MEFAKLFTFEVSPLELIMRGTLMYWFLFLAFRFVLRRDAGSFGIADLLLVVLIADASQNAMSADYHSVAEGAVLAGTLIFWNYFLDWAACRSTWVRKLAEPPPLLLIDRGRLLARNLRREHLTREDVDAQLRLNGLESMDQVRKAYMESDGSVSVIKFRDGEGPPKKPDKPPV